MEGKPICGESLTYDTYSTDISGHYFKSNVTIHLAFINLFLHHDIDSKPFLFSNFAIHESLILLLLL